MTEFCQLPPQLRSKTTKNKLHTAIYFRSSDSQLDSMAQLVLLASFVNSHSKVLIQKTSTTIHLSIN